MVPLSRISLLGKAVAILVLFSSLAMIAVAASSAWRIERNMTAQFENRGIAIANSIASSSVEVFLFSDVSTIQARIDQYMELEGVAYVFVVDPRGEFLAHTFVPGIPSEVRDLATDPHACTVRQISVAGLGEIIDIGAAILDGEVGHVHVGMDRKLIRAAIWSATTDQLLLLGAIFLLSLAGTVVLMRRIVRPLRQLTDYAHALASEGASAGHHAVAGAEILSIAGRADEVGQLAHAFRYMIDEVSAHELELRISHDDLEMRVRNRTTALGTANAALQAEIGEREAAEQRLRATAAELARSNTDLEQFAYIASHDLQEPLRKVQAFGDLLAENAGPALGAEERDYLKRMQGAARRMQGLINDLLLFARVSSQAKPFAPVDLNELVVEVLSDLETRIKTSEGAVDAGELPQLEADPLQMRQLFQNLIGNALKFHRPGVPPAIAVRAKVSQNGAGPTLPNSRSERVCEISVADNGIGFAEKYLDRIFLPFQRLHGLGEYEGTGMGLAICRKIVERHGGTITARSAPGQGTTFVVLLPVSQPRGDSHHA